ncbi:MAG: NAD(P)/FAD-dependent oxidoreductase, partial [Fusobacteriaceae bacterium]
SKFARKVSLVVRKDHVRCAQTVLDKAIANPKIEILYNTEILEIKGDGIVESAVIYNNRTGETREHFADENDGTFGIFMFIGFNPNTDLFKGHVAIDDWGYIPTDENMATNVKGIYAAGDLRPKLLRQVVTAAADGAIAATAAEKYLDEHFGDEDYLY